MSPAAAVDSLARRVVGVIFRAVLLWRTGSDDHGYWEAVAASKRDDNFTFRAMYDSTEGDWTDRLAVEVMGPEKDDGDYHWHAVSFGIDGGSAVLDIDGVLRLYDETTPALPSAVMYAVMMRAARLYNDEFAAHV